MSARRFIAYPLALALGVGAAGLVACGQGTKGGIPAGPARGLESQFEDVRQAVDARRCSDVAGQLRQVDQRINALPASVDDRLLARLRTAATRLHEIALTECNANIAQNTPTTTDTTPTTPTTTDTTPTDTTTDTTPTDTTVTDTTPVQTDTTVLPPPATTPPAPTTPPVTPPPTTIPGGGTPPVVP